MSPTDWHMTTINSAGRCPLVGNSSTISALDVTTNKIAWQKLWTPNNQGCAWGGAMTTAGGLVFINSDGRWDLGNVNLLPAGTAYGGHQYALDAKTGATLWDWQAPDRINSPAITYMVNGKQYVAVYAQGRVPTAPGGNDGKHDLLTVFSL
jgi:glucose dehydrogenase